MTTTGDGRTTADDGRTTADDSRTTTGVVVYCFKFVNVAG